MRKHLALSLALAFVGLLFCFQGQALTPTQRTVLFTSSGNQFPLPGAAIDMDFANGRSFGALISSVTVARTGTNNSSTDLHPAFCVAGLPYTRYLQNTPRIRSGYGLFVEPGPKINSLLNSTAPATQTITTQSGAASYTLWICGSGSATLSGDAECGTGTATQGNYVTFTTTANRNCTVTVSGSPYVFQLENTPYPTTFIVTGGGGSASRGDETPSGPPLPTLSSIGYAVYASGLMVVPNGANASVMTLAGMDDGSNTNRLNVFRRPNFGTPDAGRGVSSSGAAASSGDLGNQVWQYNTFAKLMISTAECDQKFAMNGGQLFLGNGGPCANGQDHLPVGPLTTVRVGRGPSAGTFSGPVSRIALFPNPQDGATILRYTSP